MYIIWKCLLSALLALRNQTVNSDANSNCKPDLCLNSTLTTLRSVRISSHIHYYQYYPDRNTNSAQRLSRWSHPLNLATTSKNRLKSPARSCRALNCTNFTKWKCIFTTIGNERLSSPYTINSCAPKTRMWTRRKKLCRDLWCRSSI